MKKGGYENVRGKCDCIFCPSEPYEHYMGAGSMKSFPQTGMMYEINDYVFLEHDRAWRKGTTYNLKNYLDIA